MDTITLLAADPTIGFDATATGLALAAPLGVAIAAGIGVAIIKLSPKIGWGIFSSLAKRG